MDQFARLHSALEDCIANPAQPASHLATIQRDLERVRPALLSLLDTRPKDAAQRALLESKGEYVDAATGISGTVGPDLRREILFLADSLGANEGLCAAYVHAGVGGKRWSGDGAEAGLELFLRERASMLECLEALWRGSLSSDARFEHSGLKELFARETHELAVRRGADMVIDPETRTKGTWASKLMHTLDSLAELTDSLHRSLAGPATSTALTAKYGASFGEETTRRRLELHREERCGLAQVLFLMAAAAQLTLTDTVQLTKQLARTPATDSAAVHLLVALLAALDALDPEGEYLAQSLPANGHFVNTMKALLVDATWTVPHLQSAVLLQWTVFLDRASTANVKFQLAETAHDAAPAAKEGPSAIIDALTDKAIQGGVFAFLGRGVLAFKRDRNLDDGWSDVGLAVPVLGSGELDMSATRQDWIMETVELLVLEIVTTRTRVLTRLRQREEDILPNSHRGGGHRQSQAGINDGPQARGHHLEALFLLIATLYRNAPPESGLRFWHEDDQARGGTKSALGFLVWGSECTIPVMVRAFYEMLCSLATGPRAAASAFQFIADAGTGNPRAAVNANHNWSVLFRALDYYQRELDQEPDSETGPPQMPVEEVPLIRAFVRLLRQVVQYSDSAREALYDGQGFKPVATTLALLAKFLPIDLKADLLAAVAAFARPGGSLGVTIARKTWLELEQSQVLLINPYADPRAGALALAKSRSPLNRDGGLLAELDEVEAPGHVYPESTAFIELLNALIHLPAPFEPLRRGIDFDSQTIPDTLGAPGREPGIDPYVRFVVDEVLLKTGQREYDDATDRWKITNIALTFVERCLATYDLGPFLTSPSPSPSPSTISQLVVHPGFDILTRLLSNSDLLATIFTIICAGYDAIDKNSAGTPLFTQCVLRCMRILRRVLELQTPFLDVFIKALAVAPVHIPQDKRARFPNLALVDQSLLFQTDAVIQIALLVGCNQEDEIALLSVQVLSVLSESRLFYAEQRFPEQSRARLNRLVGILQSSPDIDRILQGFTVRLGADVFESDLELGEATGPGGGNVRQSIRSAIVDLLLQNTLVDAPAPNIAHLILGFDVHSLASEIAIEPPHVRRTSLHVVLELLRRNLATDGDTYSSILDRHPTFAAKCYRLVRQLCLHRFTSSALSRYLRSQENFFYLQSAALPFSTPLATQGPVGRVRFSDGREVVTSSAAICATLEAQAWLLESTALELNVLAEGNDTQRLRRLVNSLFLASTDDEDDLPPEHGLAQADPRILEIFYAFDFSWSDSIVPGRPSDAWRNVIDFDSCLRPDASGTKLYDFAALVALLTSTRRDLQDRGGLNTLEQQQDVKRETLAIFETVVVENHLREIRAARQHALTAWKTLLDIAYDKAFHLFPPAGRYKLTMDLTNAILPSIAAPETDPAISELFSTAVLMLVTKARDAGVQIEAANATDALQLILRGIFVAIVQPGVSLVVRGNLYAALINYFQLSEILATSAAPPARTFQPDESMSVDGSADGSITRRGRRSALDKGNAALFLSALDRLLPTICRDAVVGTSVWRGVAFSALDTIVMVAQESRTTSKLLSSLSKQGYLQSFVSSLKDAETHLMQSLEPDPESLSAFYIYSSQMSFLIRLASTREGAEKLLDAELFARLSQCEYLGARPEDEPTSMDFDGFVPHASERHHELLLPALQLVVGTLIAFGAETAVATQQAIIFISGQRENLLIALRNAAQNRTGPAMREAHLIVTLMAIVLPSITPEDLNTLSSFGGLHSALLALSSKVCGSQDWVSRVSPTIEVEQVQEQTLVLGLGPPKTRFSETIEQLVESLEGAIFTYHNVATRRRLGTNAFRPVWLPSVNVASSAPTLGTASAFLRDITHTLSTRLQYADQVASLLDPAQLHSLDEREEALHIPTSESMLVDRERRAHVELKEVQTKYREKVTASLYLIEVALLLYWRHVDFYLDTERAERDASFNGSHSISPLALTSLRSELARSFLPVANELDGLRHEFTLVNVGPAFRAKDSYIEIVLRKIKDTLAPVLPSSAM